MTYAISAALQTAIYERLKADTVVVSTVGEAIYDAIPAGTRPDLYVSLGNEQVRDQSDMTGSGALHELVVRVVSEHSGFSRAKIAAAAVCDALHNADLNLSRGALVALQFHRGRASRVRTGEARQIDLTFRARVCDGTPVAP